MRIKDALLVLTICVLSSCSKPNETHQKLKGNWHSGILELVNNPGADSLDIEYNYSEYYFDENFMYSYSNSLKDFYSVRYFFRDDTLFYSMSNNREMSLGIVDYPNDSTQYLISTIDTTSIYRMKTDEKTLIDFVNTNPDSMKIFSNKDEFLKHFENRYQQKLKEHLKNKNAKTK